MFGNGLFETNAPPDMNRFYTVSICPGLTPASPDRRPQLMLEEVIRLQLQSADLVVPRMEAWRLLWDFR